MTCRTLLESSLRTLTSGFETSGRGDGSITGGLPALQVYDLGADGKDMKRVADLTNFAQAAERAAGGRDIFGGRSSADRKVGETFSLPMYIALLLTSCLCLSVVSRSCTLCQGQHAPVCSDNLLGS